jgi:hypothetical protein
MTTTVFAPIKEDYINNSSPNSSGNTSDIYVGKASSITTYRGLIYFNFSSASIISVSSANLSFGLNNNASNTSGTTISIYMLKSIWSEDSTWNTAKSGYSWATAGAFHPSDCEQTSIGSFYISASALADDVFNVSLDANKIQEYFIGRNNCGFLLKGDEFNSTQVKLYGRTSGSSPSLNLTYDTIYSNPTIISSGSIINLTSSSSIIIPPMENGLILASVATITPLDNTSGSLTISGSPFEKILVNSYLYGYFNCNNIFIFKNPPSGSATFIYSDNAGLGGNVVHMHFIDNVDTTNPISGSYSSLATSSQRGAVYSYPGVSNSGDIIFDFLITRTHVAGDFRAGLYNNLDYYGLYQKEVTAIYSSGGNYYINVYGSYRTSGSSMQPLQWLAYTNDVYRLYSSVSIKGLPAQTYDQYTKALLHFDGVDGSYYFRDEILNSWTPYRYPSTSGSGAIIKTDQYKFGTASGYFTGSAVGDWIQTGTQFDLATTDWTMEAQIRPNFDGISTFWHDRALFGYDLDDNNFFGCYISGSASDKQKLCYIEMTGGSSIINVFGSIMPLVENIWQHVAFVRQGTSIKGYLDGTLYLSGSCSASIATFPGQIFRIANFGSPSMYRGYMDEFRLSNTARWTSDFTPPDAPYAPITPETTQAFYRQPFMYSGYPWM